MSSVVTPFGVHPFTPHHAESIASLGETRLIAAIRRWLGTASPRAPFGIGDDCAVLPAGRGPQLLTVDPVIYGEHFDDAVSPRAVGEKLFKRNLSDIAAMGGRPRAAVVALALDSRVKRVWLEAFYRGLAAVSRRYCVPLVGGDVARHNGGIVATLTLVGETAEGDSEFTAQRGRSKTAPLRSKRGAASTPPISTTATGGARVLTRTGARVGDWIFVTGVLGGSLASGHHWKFTPRLAEGAWLARRPEVRAMLDVSDGLAKDLRALTPPGAAAALDAAALPRRRGCDVRAALCDGEDYELALAVAGGTEVAEFLRAWRRAFPRTRLSCIGKFVRAGRRPASAVKLEDYQGFEHLRRVNGRKKAPAAQKRAGRKGRKP